MSTHHRQETGGATQARRRWLVAALLLLAAVIVATFWGLSRCRANSDDQRYHDAQTATRIPAPIDRDPAGDAGDADPSNTASHLEESPIDESEEEPDSSGNDSDTESSAVVVVDAHSHAEIVPFDLAWAEAPERGSFVDRAVGGFPEEGFWLCRADGYAPLLFEVRARGSGVWELLAGTDSPLLASSRHPSWIENTTLPWRWADGPLPLAESRDVLLLTESIRLEPERAEPVVLSLWPAIDVAIRVEFEGGHPIPGVDLIVHWWLGAPSRVMDGGSREFSVRVDDLGECRVVVPARREILFWPADSDQLRVRRLETRQWAHTFETAGETLVITLPADWVYRVRVIDSQNEPVPEATVRLSRGEEGRFANTRDEIRTDRHGRAYLVESEARVATTPDYGLPGDPLWVSGYKVGYSHPAPIRVARREEGETVIQLGELDQSVPVIVEGMAAAGVERVTVEQLVVFHGLGNPVPTVTIQHSLEPTDEEPARLVLHGGEHYWFRVTPRGPRGVQIEPERLSWRADRPVDELRFQIGSGTEAIIEVDQFDGTAPERVRCHIAHTPAAGEPAWRPRIQRSDTQSATRRPFDVVEGDAIHMTGLEPGRYDVLVSTVSPSLAFDPWRERFGTTREPHTPQWGRLVFNITEEHIGKTRRFDLTLERAGEAMDFRVLSREGEPLAGAVFAPLAARLGEVGAWTGEDARAHAAQLSGDEPAFGTVDSILSPGPFFVSEADGGVTVPRSLLLGVPEERWTLWHPTIGLVRGIEIGYSDGTIRPAAREDHGALRIVVQVPSDFTSDDFRVLWLRITDADGVTPPDFNTAPELAIPEVGTVTFASLPPGRYALRLDIVDYKQLDELEPGDDYVDPPWDVAGSDVKEVDVRPGASPAITHRRG